MPAVFTRHSMLLQTAFSELKRQANDQHMSFIGSPGSVGVRRVKDRDFYYRQFYDAQGRKAAHYIGPVKDADAQRRTEVLRERIGIATSLARDARTLAQQGYVRADARVGAIVASFGNHGLFRAGAVLIGSHAYGALLNELGVRAAAFATEDVDLARGGPLAPGSMTNATTDFAEVLKDSTLPLVAIPGLGKAPSTSYKVPGPDRLRVDLLAPSSGKEATIKSVPELRAHAMALPHLRALLEEPIETALLTREGVIAIRVPRPEAFVWHKMQLPSLRRESDKKQKDILQASVLFAVLAEDAPDALHVSHASLSGSARKRVQSGAVQVRHVLNGTPHARAVELLLEFVPGLAKR